jgi:hypothetical protein
MSHSYDLNQSGLLAVNKQLWMGLAPIAERTDQAGPYLCPRNGADGSGIEFRQAALNLTLPRRLSVLVYLGVEALQQGTDESSASFHRKG